MTSQATSMATADLPKTVQYVTDSEGKRRAVLLDILAWESLVDGMESAADTRFAVKALKELQAGEPLQAMNR